MTAMLVFDAFCPACDRLVARTVYRPDYPFSTEPPWHLHVCAFAPPDSEPVLIVGPARGRLVMGGAA